MIAKITSGKSVFGALKYNQIKTENGNAKIILQNNMLEAPAARFDMALCLRSFEPNLIVNRRTENPVIHISLNPDPKDTLSNEQLSEMAEKYMTEMGYANQPYIVFKHTDIDRKHLHIVSIRVDDDGKKIDSNFENRRSMDICRKLEQEYGLHVAGKAKRTDLPELKKIDYPRGDVKHQVGNVVTNLFHNYQFQSFGEFRTLLELFNVTVEDVSGSTNGNPYHGLLYAATDNSGNWIGTPFKSSLFGKSIGYNALQKKFEQSKETIKEKRIGTQLRPLVTDVMNRATTKENFILLMKEKRVGVVFRANETGRIYGVTFLDHGNRTILNASRLGKDFSANVFNERFGESANLPTGEPSYQNKDWNYSQVYNRSIHPNISETPSVSDTQDSVAGGLFDIFSGSSTSTSTPDAGDPLWLEELKRRKKKKKGRRL